MEEIHRVERYRQITAVLGRHGLHLLRDRIGLSGGHLRGTAGERSTGRADADAVQLRQALEELGPTFIKLGQLLSTRSDLLPAPYLTEFAKLQAHVPAIDGALVVGILTEEFGAAPEELFATFDRTPLASASIGQAHAATRHDGTSVVVKVRRPGALEQVQADLEILHNLAAQADRRWAAAAAYDVVGVVAEFDRTLRAELDYLQEGRNAERFAAAFASRPDIDIPRIFWETTSSRVLTLERIVGVSVNDHDALDRERIDRTHLIATAVDAIAQMVFLDGFFHADPHPGNLFVEPSGRIGLIDFGMVGTLSPELRTRLAALFLAALRRDADRISAALVAVCVPRDGVRSKALRADVVQLSALYEGKSLGEVKMGALIGGLLAMLRRHRLRLQPEIATLIRMLLIVEGMGVDLDPAFSLGEALRPWATRLLAERFSPAELARQAGRTGLELASLGAETPEMIRRLYDLIESNDLQVHLRASELDPFITRLERVGNRLVAGVIVAALITSAGAVAGAGAPARAGGRRPVAVAGLGALTAYLAWTARRSPGRPEHERRNRSRRRRDGPPVPPGPQD